MDIALFTVMMFSNLVLAFLMGYFFSMRTVIQHVRKSILPKTGKMIDKMTPENQGEISGRMQVIDELMDITIVPFKKRSRLQENIKE